MFYESDVVEVKKYYFNEINLIEVSDTHGFV